jgi:hypothetical protein
MPKGIFMNNKFACACPILWSIYDKICRKNVVKAPLKISKMGVEELYLVLIFQK